MLYEIMRHIRNFFPGECRSGSFEIIGGTVSLPFVAEGQHILIEGSKFNDGVYKYPAPLTDESFVGTITALNLPKEFITLTEEIEEWSEKNVPSAYSSESFGGYSYQKATTKSGVSVSWKEVFASRLNSWRKL